MRSVAVHEVFGHGIAALADEYVQTVKQANSNTGYIANDSTGLGYRPNMLPISTGCSEWCEGLQPVSWVITQMQNSADNDLSCWSLNKQTTCDTPPDGKAACRWIGGLPAIPYWGSYKCIPLNAAKYNVGINCDAYGDQGCYLLAPRGTDSSAIMDVVQPNGMIMQSFHSSDSEKASGFSSPVENYIRDLMDCVFNPNPCGAAGAKRCTDLLSRHATPNNGYINFLQSALSCEADGVTSRRR